MELPFEKSVCRYWKQTLYRLHEQEQTQELRLPEGMPDVGRVISSWGQVILRGKEWDNRSAGISGGVMVWVLYQPEDRSSPRKLETWVPFQSRVDMPPSEQDGVIRVECILRSLDVRISSTRKLVLRCSVGLLVQVLVPDMLELFLPPELPEDLEILRKAYPLTLIRETGEKTFSLDEVLEHTAGLGIEELVYYRFAPDLLDQKVMGDKAVFRAQGNLHVLYRDRDGRLACTDLEIPFAQYTELDGAYESDARVDHQLCLSSMELDLEEDGSLHLRCGMVSQYCVRGTVVFECVQDAYSPCRDVEVSVGEVQVSAVLDTQSRTLELAQKLTGEGKSVVDPCVFQSLPRLSDPENVTVEGHFNCLMQQDDQLHAGSAKWAAATPWKTACPSDTVCFTRPKGTVSAARDGADWRAQTQLVLDLSSIRSQNLQVVTGMSLGQERAPDPGRPAVIIRSKGETDSLWDIAKKCGSTVSAIERMNALEQEPEADRLLLIPVL